MCNNPLYRSLKVVIRNKDRERLLSSSRQLLSCKYLALPKAYHSSPMEMHHFRSELGSISGLNWRSELGS
jgi:hypothetical protein